VFALIPAAGSGTRFAGGAPKQYATLAGKPMLWHAVRAVCVPPVETVFVVLAAGDRSFAGHDWSAFAGRLEPLYCGGESRRDSVFNGLVAAMAGMSHDDWVLVHDAARPCLSRKELESLISEVRSDSVGGLLALPVSDTVKRAAKDEAGAQRVAGTEDRAQLFEALGVKPRLVAGSRENLKVTWPEDLAIAEAILARRA
jgi:2-C-methyl-D-erythritol 4-phosphate cytidylyltransferase